MPRMPRLDSPRRTALLGVPLLLLTACLSTPSSLAGDAAPESGMVVKMGLDAHVGVDGGHAGDAGRDATLPSHDGASFPDVGSVVLDASLDGGPPQIDAYIRGDGGPSRCTISSTAVSCTEQQLTITTPAGSDPGADTTYPSYQRLVFYQVPLGTAPEAGWPAVFMFQGSFISAEYTFSATSSEDFGLYYQTELVKLLLDAGFAVLAPEALESGTTAWQTNIAPYADNWPGAPDDLLIQAMLADVGSGMFGPLDPTELFATGISSGGYMTSRMAVSYVGKFKALAIESGSYATCLESLCTVPTLSATHPPTLFLHGALDPYVPESTVTEYETALAAAGVTYKEVDDPDAGHQWIPEAPAAVLSWFETYR